MASELVPVEQIDRDAAAELIAWHNTCASEWHIKGGADLRFFAADMPDGARRGIWDEHPFVQAFAAHRQRAMTQAAEAAAGRALEAAAGVAAGVAQNEHSRIERECAACISNTRYNRLAAKARTARDIATAIRSLDPSQIAADTGEGRG